MRVKQITAMIAEIEILQYGVFKVTDDQIENVEKSS